MSERNNFSYSKSRCGPIASHQVWAKFDLGFGRRCGLKIFKMAVVAAILDIGTKRNSESLCHFDNTQPSFGSVRLAVWYELSFEEYRDGHRGGHLGYQNGKNLAILNFYVAPMPPIKFRFNPTYSCGGDVVWRILRRSPWRPSWASERNDLNNSEYIPPMLPIKFRLNPTYSFGGDVVWRISRWLQ